jgi:drug/metabolite transporter (DMT)-like permease
MILGEFFGALLALAGGLIWGSGDFFGGQASRRANSLHVAVFGATTGILALIVLATVLGEGVPDRRSLLLGGASGLFGLLGLTALYRGFVLGSTSIVAMISTVLAQAIPVIYAAIRGGLPEAQQMIGFAAALVGCALVSRSGAAVDEKAKAAISIRQGVLSGIGFGGFLICIAETSIAHTFGSLAAGRFMMVAAALLLIYGGGGRLDRSAASAPAVASGLLDVGGNALFLIARQFTRFDVAVVLGSLYPIATILLSRIFLKEHIARVQWIGIAVCGVAVALIVS